jgi:hypothetical protein
MGLVLHTMQNSKKQSANKSLSGSGGSGGRHPPHAEEVPHTGSAGASGPPGVPHMYENSAHDGLGGGGEVTVGHNEKGHTATTGLLSSSLAPSTTSNDLWHGTGGGGNCGVGKQKTEHDIFTKSRFCEPMFAVTPPFESSRCADPESGFLSLPPMAHRFDQWERPPSHGGEPPRWEGVMVGAKKRLPSHSPSLWRYGRQHTLP